MKKSKAIINWVKTCIVILVVCFVGLLVGLRLFGLKPYIVLSGSMEPVYSPGDFIYVKAIDPYELQTGDVITFVFGQDSTVATHRIIQIDVDDECFYTKGDANDHADAAPVRFRDVIGKPVFALPYIGYVSSYIQSASGRYVAIAGCAVILILLLLPNIIKGFSRKSDDESDEDRKADVI